MVDLVTTSNWEATCLAFKKANPSWILLDREVIRSMAKCEDNRYEGKHFILSYDLANRRYTLTKINTLVAYLLVQARRKYQTFSIIAPSKSRLDLRIQRMVDKEIDWV